MKLITKQHYENEWTAHDEETYDGAESQMGYGNTEQDAVDDLKEKMDAKHQRGMK